MSRLSAVDLGFLLVETQVRPMHMSSCVVYSPPPREKKNFVRKVVQAFRTSEVGRPFNQKLKWLDDGVARWEPAEPDMNYHVRHVAIPAPGTLEQLDELLALLNPPLLDRAYPLWQCFVVEGLEDGRFALFFKMHHAIIDGEGSVKVFKNTLSTDQKDREIRPFWQPLESPPKKKRARVSQSQLQKFRAQINTLPSGLMNFGADLIGLGAQALTGRAGSKSASLPFRAPETPFNIPTLTSARSYANCALPLDRVRSVAKRSGCTVNDVLMTCVDHALHAYLAEKNRAIDSPLVAAMPVSARTKGQASEGNQVSSDLVTMGQPKASLVERLEHIHEATSEVKTRANKMPVAMRQLYSLLLFGAATLPEITPGMTAAPSYNLIVSNMAGPQGRLYMGGAALVGIRGMPIVPPNPGLNVTFVSLNDQICLAVGCTPDSMSDPARYLHLLERDFLALEQALMPKKAPARKTRRKTTSGRTTPARRNKEQ